jgi:transposase-like protein
MAVMIGGKPFWLWQAVDSEGEVLDLLVQRQRDKAAALKLMRKLLKEARLRARDAGDRQAEILQCGEVRARTFGSS